MHSQQSLHALLGNAAASMTTNTPALCVHSARLTCSAAVTAADRPKMLNQVLVSLFAGMVVAVTFRLHHLAYALQFYMQQLQA